MKQNWPRQIWIVRHGESAGNVARDAADLAGHARIEIEERDVDVPLSALGRQQSDALAAWFSDLPLPEQPNVILASPYKRAVQTAQTIAGHLSPSKGLSVGVDERLREKEFGVLDRLTRRGIEELQPDQAEFRRILGKFYHRPPAGESWCDVILRLRSMLDTISLHYADQRVLIVAHQVVVLCMRYIIENLSEEQILEIDRQGDVVNCGVTEYVADAGNEVGGGLVLKRYNFVAPLIEAGAPVTAQTDANVAAR
ncbi:histidine phosphatase family protein [Rhizobium leguminosarum bv. trifolii]|uniref:histidine phosphatase family protein n=2 Tax=Rhizobium TaxID=379 RepID=UPI000E2F9F7F|nr:histidine phosphatase family protein [Rhizobium leguminosarum]RFB88790.1 histidine phosphatase family protein [Rhizobium leguminosarum bv. trifolii]